MKILAKIDSGRFIVEASARELAQICGAEYEINMTPQPAPGITIHVSDRWTKIIQLERMPGEIRAASERLKVAASILTQTVTVLTLTEPNQNEQ